MSGAAVPQQTIQEENKTSAPTHAVTESAFAGEPLPPAEMKKLDSLLFGASPVPADVERWHMQGFTFSDKANVSFGLSQLHGGPCGILAPVQAFILHDLLWVQKTPTFPDSAQPIRPTEAQRTLALIRALSRVLVAASTVKNQFTLIRGTFPDALERVVVTGVDKLQRFLASHMVTLRSPCGVLLFVYSALSTRGLTTISADTDDNTQPLVGRFGHCSQELVNLMLCGRAVTNVFDGDKVLGDASDPTAFALHGIPDAGDVGFLTLLEAMRYSKVGDNYKCPKTPIWVIGSASHYTVLFALEAEVGQMADEDKEEQEIKRAFGALDPEENGFIPTTDLHKLIAALKLPCQPYDLQRKVDPDGTGIVLWHTFKPAALEMQRLPSHFNCAACTFQNPRHKTHCEICGTAAPKQTAAPSPAPSEGKHEPTSFTLFHYNGIDKGKDRARCTPVTVTRLGVTGHAASTREGLREVILTKWPQAFVEYTYGEPKIV